MREMEQPREPIFYPNKEKAFYLTGENSDTLQSIDRTLKRIEKLLIQITESQKGQITIESLTESLEKATDSAFHTLGER